jgi:hypothetical protein
VPRGHVDSSRVSECRASMQQRQRALNHLGFSCEEEEEEKEKKTKTRTLRRKVLPAKRQPRPQTGKGVAELSCPAPRRPPGSCPVLPHFTCRTWLRLFTRTLRPSPYTPDRPTNGISDRYTTPLSPPFSSFTPQWLPSAPSVAPVCRCRGCPLPVPSARPALFCRNISTAAATPKPPLKASKSFFPQTFSMRTLLSMTLSKKYDFRAIHHVPKLMFAPTTTGEEAPEAIHKPHSFGELYFSGRSRCARERNAK